MKANVDTSLQLAGCQFVSKQLSKLTKHLQGAKTAEDIEDVHQARVACRRLRSALVIFSDCFDADKLGVWNKQIKKLLKSFGAARDLDVQIEFLQWVLDGLDNEHRRYRPGIKRMMLRWQGRRDAIQPQIVKVIDRLQKDHVLMNIHLEVERILFHFRHQEVPPVSTEMTGRALDQIQERTVDLLARRACLQQPQDVPEHHAMRISAKKLRYTMEIFDAAMGGNLKGPIKKIKKIQTILGDLHDCDVWDDDIDAFIEQEKQRTIDYYGNARPFARIVAGLDNLQQERRQRRSELLNEAHAYFEQLETDRFWESFLDVLKDDPKTKQTSPKEAEDSEKEEDKQSEQPENSDPV